MKTEELPEAYEQWCRERGHTTVPAGFVDRVMQRASVSIEAPPLPPSPVLLTGLAAAAALVFLVRLFALASLFLVP